MKRLETRSKRLIVDCETDGLWNADPKKSYTKLHVIVTRDLDDGTVKTYHDLTSANGNTLKDFISDTQDASFIGHNFLGFDWWVFNDLLGYVIPITSCTDTLCMSRIDDSNRLGGHSLEAWGERLGVSKPEHSDWSVLSDAMIHRCTEDTRINTKLYNLLVNNLRDKKVPWGEVDLECFVHWKMTETERNGFYFDIQQATILRSQLVDKRQACEDQLERLFYPLAEPEKVKGVVGEVHPTSKKSGTLVTRNLRGCPEEWFNEGSSFCWVSFPEASFTRDNFVRKHLQRAGWKPKVFTPSGLPKLDDELLDDVISQVGETYRPYQEWRILNTRITKQIDKWLEFYNDTTHRQHGKIIHIGTRTHRMAHRDPPITQVPSSDSPYGDQCRQVWCVPEGKVLLGCDASGIQLRVLAHYLDSPEWTDELINGDVHQRNADILEVERPKAKTFIYAFLLGAGIPKLATTINKPIDVTSKLYKRFISETPGLESFMKTQKKQAAKGYIYSGISGRWIPCQSDWHGDWLASLLQEGEATLVKRALRIWTRRADKEQLKYTLVTQNHDEWQTEVDNLETANKLGPIQALSLTQSGRYYNCKCPIDGEWRVGKSWQETH